MQVTNQSKRYTCTTYNLQVLELQSVRYTYTTYNFQASNKSIKTLYLHSLQFVGLRITIRTYTYTTYNFKANKNSIKTLHLHNL